eukprot:s2675_g2.t6
MFISWISDAAQTWWKWNVELPVDLCTPEVTVHLSGCKCKWCRKPESWFEAARKKKHSPTLVGLPEAQRVKWKPLATLAEDDTLAIAEPEGAEVAPGCLSTMFMGLRQAAKAGIPREADDRRNRPCAARRVGSGATSRGRRVLLEHVHQPDVVGAGAGDRGANPGAGGPGRALVEPAWTGTGTRQTCSGRVLLQFGFQLGRSVSLYVITFGRRLVVEVDVLANLRQMIQNFMKNGKPASLADMLERVTRHIWTHRWKSCCSAASLREWRVKVFFYLHVGPAPPVAEHARPDFAKFSDPAWNPLCQIL